MPDLPPPSLLVLPLASLDPSADLVLVWDASASSITQMTVGNFLLNRYAWTYMPDAPTIIPNCNGGLTTRFETTITTNRVLNTPIGGVDGLVVTIRIKQGGAGSNIMNLALWTVASDVNTTASTALGTTDFLTAVLAGGRWVIIAYTKGAVGI